MINSRVLSLLFFLFWGIVNSSLFAQDVPTEEQALNDYPQADTIRIKMLIKASIVYLYNNPQRSEAFDAEAIAISRQLKNPLFEAKALLNAGLTMLSQTKYKEALSYTKQSLELSNTNGLVLEKIKALSKLSSIYGILGDFQKAAEYSNLAIQEAQQSHQNQHTITKLQVALGILYAESKNPDKSIALFKQIVAELERLQDWNFLILVQINMANALSGAKHTEEALALYASTKKLIDQYSKNPQNLVFWSLGVATLNNDCHKPQDAIKALMPLLEGDSSLLAPPERGYAYYTLATSYLLQKNYSLSISYGEKASMLFDTFGGPENNTIQLKQILAEAYHQSGDLNKSISLLQDAHVLRDSLEEQEHQKNLSLSLVKHEIESNEWALEQKNQQLTFRNKGYQIAMFFMIPLLAIIAFALYLRTKLIRAREKASIQKQLNAELEEKVIARTQALEVAHATIQEAKERENISLALLNQQHVELLQELSKKIQTWQDLNIVSDKQLIQPVLNNIKVAKNKAEEWGSFMLHFERIHPNFALSLQQHCPELNANDLKHCAYMRLGMARKQVAETLHCSEEAVKHARNRIRRKLGLAADDSLQAFINQWQVKNG